MSETLNNQLKRVNNEKNELTEEANRIIENIKLMRASLDGTRLGQDYDDADVRVTYPLARCLKSLKERHNAIAKLHRERVDQVKSTSLKVLM